MNNNDLLTRLRFALDLDDSTMVEIFELGGQEMSRNNVAALLERTEDNTEVYDEENKYALECTDEMLERFLNGFITFKS